MADLLSTLQRFAGGREGCFDSASKKIDAAGICHEVRSVALSPGEQILVSFRPVDRKHTRDKFCQPGELCNLRGLQLDSTVLVCVWASTDQHPSGCVGDFNTETGVRAIGEVRISLKHLLAKCDGCLYHNWVVLDSPGLNASVASIGMLHDDVQDTGESLLQSMSNAARQVQQPKVCLTLCRVEDLGQSDNACWTLDVQRKDRVARWGPLLRSQQQHVMLCTAQHLDRQRRQKETVSHKDAGNQAKQMAESREHTEKLNFADSQEGKRLEQQIADTRAELVSLGDEANSKIEKSNAHIRALGEERDKAVQDVNEQIAKERKQQQIVDNLKAERDHLSEQKECLLRIVEDLHQTCADAGLQMTTGRRSIDSLSGLRLP